GNGRMLVDIEFGELHAPARLADDLFKHRGQLLAWAAPGRPEIDQNRLAARFLDNVGGERGGGNVLYDVRALRGRLASAGTGGCAPVGPSVQASEGDVHFACAGVVRIVTVAHLCPLLCLRPSPPVRHSSRLAKRKAGT